MKLQSSDFCNLEFEMRKGAANELHKNLHLQSEIENRSTKRIKWMIPNKRFIRGHSYRATCLILVAIIVCLVSYSLASTHAY